MPHYSGHKPGAHMGGGAYKQQTGGRVVSSPSQGADERPREDLLPGHVVDGRLIEGGFHVRGTHPEDPPADIAATPGPVWWDDMTEASPRDFVTGARGEEESG